jgi:hypothetical protein
VGNSFENLQLLKGSLIDTQFGQLAGYLRNRTARPPGTDQLILLGTGP